MSNNSTSALTIRVQTTGVSAALSQIRGLATGIIHELAAPLAGLASVAGFSALVKHGLEFADTMGKVAQVVGVSAKEMAGLAFAAEQSDVSVDSLKMALRNFSEELIKTGQGGMNLRDALLEQSRLFQEMPDGVTKAARATELFGRAGLQLIPFLNEGPEKMQKLIDRGMLLSGVNEDMAQSAQEFNDAVKEMEFALKGLATTLALPLVKGLTDAANGFSDLIGKYQEWAAEHKKLATFLNPLSAWAKGWQFLGAASAGEIIDVFEDEPKPTPKPKPHVEDTRDFKTDRAADLQHRAVNEIQARMRLLALTGRRLALEEQLVDLAGRSIDLDARKKADNEAEDKKLITRAEWLKLNLENSKEELEIATQRKAVQEQLDQFSFRGSMNLGLNKLTEEFGNISGNLATTALDGIRMAVAGVSDAIMGAIDGTKTWGQVFAQVGRSIIAGLINVVVQWIANMTIIAALKRLFGVKDNAQAAQSAAAWAPAAIAASIASYGTAALIGTSAYVLSLGTGTALTAAMSAGAGVGGFAQGGRPPVGQVSIVGERGPELFVPNTAGSIIPSSVSRNIMADAGGAMQPSVNVSPSPVYVVNVKDESEFKRFMESHMGEQIVVNHINRNRFDVGLQT